jgi:Spy/CpxP family protein refolding chaperone
MKKSALILALALAVSALSATAQDQGGSPPAGDRPAAREGGSGGPVGQGGFHLLPPRAMEQLNLTADQQKQVTALETETKAKLEKILTADQLEQLKQMRPPQRPGGKGGDGHHGGGSGGPDAEDHPQPPPQE